MAFLGKHGSRLGGNTGQYLLRWLNWDAFVVSPDMAAAVRMAGLDISDNPTSKRDLEKIQAQINTWAKETGLARKHISRILAMSIGENRAPEALRQYIRSEARKVTAMARK